MKNQIFSVFPDNISAVAVTAPAGPADKTLVQTALTELAQHVKVKNYIAEASADNASYLASDALRRSEMFNRAIHDDEIDLILALRGGFGSVHILQNIDYDTLRKRNLPVMGYSDITAIHCAMLAKHAGIPIAGCNLLQLGEVMKDDLSIVSHNTALLNVMQKTILPAPKLAAVNTFAARKSVSAPAYAGNLTVLSSLCGTEFMPDFKSNILIIEDVNEPVYKIDRCLQQLKLNGVLQNISALVFGVFSGKATDKAELEKLFQRFAADLKCPVYKNFQFGHVYPMCAVNSSLTLTVGDGSSPQYCI